MKTVWARIGMNLELTDDEYAELIKYSDGSSELMNRLAREGRIYPCGDSYTPDCSEVDGQEIGIELSYSDDWDFKGGV